MKVSKIELFHINIPLKNNFFPSWIPGYPQTHNRCTLLKITTNDGYEGLAAGIAFSTEREGLGDLLAPYLLGNDPCDLPLAHQRITEGGILHWRNYWMETAFYDIKAQVEDKPIWKMLGGSDKPIPVYYSTGEVCRPDHHAKIVNKAQTDGYAGAKLRVHAKTLEEDINTIKSCRKLTDLDFPVAVDANQGWPLTIVDKVPNWDLERARNFVEGVSDQNIAWLEEPLEMHAYQEYAKLRQYSPIPIAGCEMNSGWHEAKMLFHFESLDIYQPDTTVFGITDTLKVIEETKKRNLIFSPHTWTNGVGLVANLHTYALTNRDHPLEFPYEPGSWTPEYRDAILKKPLLPVNGQLELPTEPGLGADVDWEKVKRGSIWN